MTAASPLRRSADAPTARGIAATARHRRTLALTGIISEVPTLVLVRQGIKQMTRDSSTIRLQAGGAVVVPAGLAFDLVNTPVAGEFVATVLSPAPHLVDEFAQDYPTVPAIRTAHPVEDMEPEFLAAFERVVRALSGPDTVPDRIVDHREREVLIWLAGRGLRFGRAGRTTTAQQVRALLSNDVARPWQLHDVARSVSMSEATVRRRLHEDGLTFRQLLIDVRMTRALSLLQLTDLPVAQVAFDVGYDSASRFAARFKQRFDISPSAIRQ